MNINNVFLQKACENIYDYVKQDDGCVNKAKFIEDLKVRGLLTDDPRLSEFVQAAEKAPSHMEKEMFVACISRNISVIENAFTDSNIVSNFEAFAGTLQNTYNMCKENDSGAMADYIPQLAKQNPDHFGLSVCTIDGQRLNIGDTDIDFCIQSCSKPITYCLALEEHGVDKVHKHVGREPSGIQFNALKLNKIGLPHNPLINSGAIMSCSLVKNHLEPADRFDYVLEKWEQAAGGFQFGYSNSVYLSERMTGDRNFALAYFMREHMAFPENSNLIDVIEFYFQCCSITTTCNYLSIVAATLANGGVCPLTGEKVFNSTTVKNCLSMMYSCGMYDYSGEFGFTVGLPAKSGVAGGIFVVIPNVMGICSFSPKLDKYGNSARGVDLFLRLINNFNFHLFDNIEMTTSTKNNPRRSKDHGDISVEKLIKYASVGDLGALKRLRIKNYNLAAGDYDRRSPLHLAASNGHLKVVQYLHEQGGVDDVNPIDRMNGTPYDDAVREGHHEIAEYLLRVGGKSGNSFETN